MKTSTSSPKKQIEQIDQVIAQFKELQKEFPQDPSIPKAIHNLQDQRARITSSLGRKG